MALTVTPGGASDDSLATLAEFGTYCAAMGYDLEPYTESQEEQALRRATVWVEGIGARTDGRVGSRWPGARATAIQRREWPRAGATLVDGTALPSDAIPPQIAEAVCEAAFYSLGNPGALHGALTLTAVATSQQVGPIRVGYSAPEREHQARAMLTVVSDLLGSLLVPEPTGPHLYMHGIGPR